MKLTEKIRALIVDDEKKACTNLKNMLNEYVGDEIEVVGVAHNTHDAEQLIATLNPDVLFLDIEMPNENAFHFLDRIAPVNFDVIFATAYDEYAIRAFKLNAVDYILKPISITELVTAINRLKDRTAYKKIKAENSSYSDILNQVKDKSKQTRLVLRESGNTEFVDFADIYFLEANGSYCRILFQKSNLLLKQKAVRDVMLSNPLSEYEEILPSNQFYRIHKSYLVNCAKVKKIVNDDNMQVQITDDIFLPISRRRFPQFMAFLKSNHYDVE